MRWFRTRHRLFIVRLLPVLAAVWLVSPLHACPLTAAPNVLDGGDCPLHEVPSADVTHTVELLAPCCDSGPAGVVPDLPHKLWVWDGAIPGLSFNWIVRSHADSVVLAPSPPPPIRRPLHLTKQALLI